MAGFEIGGQKRIRRRADQCCHPANGGGKGNAQHERGCKMMGVVRIMGRVVAPLGRDCLTNGQHDHGRGCIADPHAEECRGHHDGANHRTGVVAASAGQGIGNETVQLPALHGPGNKKATQKQENERVGIGGGDPIQRDDLQHGKQDQRKQRCCGEGNGFAHPPDRHQHSDGRDVDGL